MLQGVIEERYAHVYVVQDVHAWALSLSQATQYIRVFRGDIIYRITTVNVQGCGSVGHHRIPRYARSCACIVYNSPLVCVAARKIAANGKFVSTVA